MKNSSYIGGVSSNLFYYRIQLISLTNLPSSLETTALSDPKNQYKNVRKFPHYYQLAIGDKSQELYITERFQSTPLEQDMSGEVIYFNAENDIVIELKAENLHQPQYMYFSIYIDGERENRVKLQVEKYVNALRMRNIEFVLMIRNAQSKLKLRMMRDNEMQHSQHSQHSQRSSHMLLSQESHQSRKSNHGAHEFSNNTGDSHFQKSNSSDTKEFDFSIDEQTKNEYILHERTPNMMLHGSSIPHVNQTSNSSFNDMKSLFQHANDLLQSGEELFPPSFDGRFTTSQRLNFPMDKDRLNIPSNSPGSSSPQTNGKANELQVSLMNCINQQRAHITNLETDHAKTVQQYQAKIMKLEEQVQKNTESRYSSPSSLRGQSPVQSRTSSPLRARNVARNLSPSRVSPRRLPPTKGRPTIISSSEYQSLLETCNVLEQEKRFLSKQIQKLKTNQSNSNKQLQLDMEALKKEKEILEANLKHLNEQHTSLQKERDKDARVKILYKNRVDELATYFEHIIEDSVRTEESQPLQAISKGITDLQSLIDSTSGVSEEISREGNNSLFCIESGSPSQKDKVSKLLAEKRIMEKNLLALQKEKEMLLKKLHLSDHSEKDRGLTALDHQLREVNQEKNVINDEITKIFTSIGGTIDSMQYAIRDEIDAILLQLSSVLNPESEHLNMFSNLTLLIQKQFTQYEDTIRLLIHKFSRELGVLPNWEQTDKTSLSTHDFWQEVKALKEAIKGQDFKSVDLHRQAKEIRILTTQLEEQIETIRILKSENQTLQSKVGRLTKNENSLQKAKEYSYKELHETQNKLRSTEKDLQSIKDKNQILMKQCKDLTVTNVTLKDTNERILREADTIRKEMEEIQYKMEDTKSDNERLQHNLEARDLELEEMLLVIENLKQRELESENKKEEDLRQLRREINTLQRDNERLISRLESRDGDREKQIQKLQIELDSFEMDNNRLKEIIKELNIRQDKLTHEFTVEKQQLIKEYNGKISTQSSEHKNETYTLHLKIKQYQELLGEMEKKLREQARRTSSSLPQDEYKKLKESYESEIKMLQDQISDIDQIHQDEMTLYKAEVDKEVKGYRNTIEKLEKEKDVLILQIEGEKKAISTVKEEQKSVYKLLEDGNQEIQSLHMQVEALEKSKVFLEQQVETLNDELRIISETQLSQVKSMNESEESPISNSETKLISMESSSDLPQTQSESASGTISEATTTQMIEASSLSNVLLPTNSTQEELEDLLRQKNDLIQKLERNNRLLKQENDELLVEISKIEQEHIASKNEERQELMEKLELQKELLDQCQSDLDARIAFNSTLSKENSELQETITALKSEIANLKEKLQEIQEAYIHLQTQMSHDKANYQLSNEIIENGSIDEFKVCILEQTISEKVSEIQILNTRIERMREELSDKNDKIQNLQLEMQKLQESARVKETKDTASVDVPLVSLPQAPTRSPTHGEHVPLKIAHILFEFISTEQNYVYSLDILNAYFIQPIKASEVLSDSEFKSIFQHLDSVQMVNTLFLTEIRKYLVNEGTNAEPSFTMEDYSNFVTCTSQFIPSFKLYTAYIQHYAQSMNTLRSVGKKNERYNALLQNQLRKVKGLHLRSFTMQSLMVAPVQRIPRYKLLLSDLRKNTTETKVIVGLDKAISTIESIAQFCDSKVLEAELSHRFLEICHMHDLKFLIEPGRKLRLEMDIEMHTTKGWQAGEVFICSDIIIVKRLKKPTKKKHISLVSIPLSMVELHDETNITIEGTYCLTTNEMYSNTSLQRQTLRFPTKAERDEFHEEIARATEYMGKSVKAQ